MRLKHSLVNASVTAIIQSLLWETIMTLAPSCMLVSNEANASCLHREGLFAINQTPSCRLYSFLSEVAICIAIIFAGRGPSSPKVPGTQRHSCL